MANYFLEIAIAAATLGKDLNDEKPLLLQQAQVFALIAIAERLDLIAAHLESKLLAEERPSDLYPPNAAEIARAILDARLDE